MNDETRWGHTAWLRFLTVFAVGGIAASVLMVGLSQGTLAASISISGASFQVAADNVRGSGFVQYGQVDKTSKGHQPVAVNGFKTAKLDNFCQSFAAKNVPVVGTISVKLSAPGVAGMEAENMIVDLSQLNADLELTDPYIGVDASKVDGPPGSVGTPGAFGLQAKGIKLGKLRQTTWTTTAATIKFHGMSLSAKPGSKNQCF